MEAKMTSAQRRAEARKHGALEHVKIGDWLRIRHVDTIRAYEQVVRVGDAQVSTTRRRFWKDGCEVSKWSSYRADPATPGEAAEWSRSCMVKAAEEAERQRATAERQKQREADPYWRATWRLSSIGDAAIAEVLRACITPEQAEKIRDYTPHRSEAK